jgi:hypothetical protein
MWFCFSSLVLLLSFGMRAAPSHAETVLLDLVADAENSVTFAALMQQVDALAGNSVNQVFARNSTATEVLINISGARYGQLVPLLRTKVSRSDWQRDPRVATWTRYFNISASLLGFNKPQVAQASTAAVPAAPGTTPVPFPSIAPTSREDVPGFRDD